MKMKPFTLNIKGKLMRVDTPLVMAILNATPDSFYSGSRTNADPAEMRSRVARMVAEGADIIDIGACSTRPGAEIVDASIELDRVCRAIEAVKAEAGCDMPISVDTFRATVAEAAIDCGAHIINDISGGNLDAEMPAAIARLQVPYVLMHMRGTPATMQQMCDYGADGVVAEVVAEMSQRLTELHRMGVNDIIIDPGFGFAKTVEQNFELLDSLADIGRLLESPILVGMSRKSMLTRTLGITPDEALNATTVVNTLALERGAAILRVHDVKAAQQAVTLYLATHNK